MITPRPRSKSPLPPPAALEPTDPPVLEPGDSPKHPMAPWFASARRQRRERRRAGTTPTGARRTPPPTRAVITIVHNEPVMLPLWLRYYSRFFAPQDIYVLDNGGAGDGPFNRVAVEHETVDHEWMVGTVERLQHELIERYDVVVVCDVDELVVANPAHGTLGDYLDRFEEEWVNCLGYELLHIKDSEPELELERPILRQRGHWFFNGAYDKAAVAMVPMHWRPGFHGRADSKYNLEPDLRLVHLHRMDFALCRERHRIRSRKAWAERDARDGWARHNQIVEEGEFEHWFYEDSSTPWVSIDPEPIPQLWRAAF